MDSTDSKLNKTIDETEINKSIHDFKNGKASGIDLITMKSGCVYLQKPITKLFNYILNYRNFPNTWTCSLLTPFHKNGPVDDPYNNRGVAVSNAISKVFLKIINKRLDYHMSDSNFWTKHQNGF